MKSPPDPHYRHRFPAEIIGHAVWLYHVFSLSLRDVELPLAERAIVVSYETVRRWCQKFGESFADRLRRRRPRPGDKWHLDEGHCQLNVARQGGEQHSALFAATFGNYYVTLGRDPAHGSCQKSFCDRLS